VIRQVQEVVYNFRDEIHSSRVVTDLKLLEN